MADGTVPGWLGSDPHCVRRFERVRQRTFRVESNRSACSSHLAVCAHHTSQRQRDVLQNRHSRLAHGHLLCAGAPCRSGWQSLCPGNVLHLHRLLLRPLYRHHQRQASFPLAAGTPGADPPGRHWLCPPALLHHRPGICLSVCPVRLSVLRRSAAADLRHPCLPRRRVSPHLGRPQRRPEDPHSGSHGPDHRLLPGRAEHLFQPVRGVL